MTDADRDLRTTESLRSEMRSGPEASPGMLLCKKLRA